MANALIEQMISVSTGLVSDATPDLGDEVTALDYTLGVDTIGATPDLTGFASVADFDAGIAGTPHDEWYNRIWVFPPVLRPVNPQLDTDIPFGIFNAFRATVTLDAITATGATGLTLDIVVTDTIGALAVRTVNIQIGVDAPASILANYLFEFDLGSGALAFIATVVDFVTMFPDDPVTEVWSWKTQVLTNFDGSEQRIALREVPRRMLDFFFLLDQEQRRQQYRRFHRSLGNRIVVPFYWYGARITQDVSAGATQIYFDPAKTNIRDGEYLIIGDPVTLTGQLVTIDEVQADGATIEGTLSEDITTRMIAAPGIEMRLIDKAGGLRMKTLAGEINVKAESLTNRTTFARLGSSSVITVHDGYDVLDIQPIARDDSDEIFEAGYELIDNETGPVFIDQNWSHPFVSGSRKFRIDREGDSTELDYWRDFLEGKRGRQTPFLFQTWHSDLFLAADVEAESNVIILPTVEYATELFPFETYKRLAIVTANGTIYRTVESATIEADGTTTLLLVGEFGSDPGDTTILRVSFLNLVRLGSDDVTLVHDRRYSILELNIRTVDA